MYFLLISTLLTCLSFAQGLHIPNVAANMKYKIDTYLNEWSESLDSNTIRTPECLAAFTAQISALSETFESSYASCLQTAEDERAAVDQAVQEQRTQLQTDASSTCSLYSDCNEQTSSLDFFSCYSDSSNQAAKLSLAIGVSANQAVQSINFSYERILYEQTRCTSTASQVYSQGFNQANVDLNNCLAGKPVEKPSTSTSTTQSSSSSSTTQPSVSTTTTTQPQTSVSTTTTTQPQTSVSTTKQPQTPETTSDSGDVSTVEKSPEEDLDYLRLSLKQGFKYIK